MWTGCFGNYPLRNTLRIACGCLRTLRSYAKNETGRLYLAENLADGLRMLADSQAIYKIGENVNKERNKQGLGVDIGDHRAFYLADCLRMVNKFVA